MAPATRIKQQALLRRTADQPPLDPLLAMIIDQVLMDRQGLNMPVEQLRKEHKQWESDRDELKAQLTRLEDRCARLEDHLKINRGHCLAVYAWGGVAKMVTERVCTLGVGVVERACTLGYGVVERVTRPLRKQYEYAL
ncbi:hypothetical protein CPB85DRAFT_459305 [Mucidula mucida]|nr:hypothetical protein CPB85DRAFT_459305 [Mucidula mucida]